MRSRNVDQLNLLKLINQIRESYDADFGLLEGKTFAELYRALRNNEDLSNST